MRDTRKNERTDTVKRLIVDDLRNLPLEAKTVRTAAQAIAALDEEDWDEIWLDFDLGGKAYETDDDLTVMPLVSVLESWEWKRNPPIIYIHTMNPVGRNRIKAALGSRYVCIDVALSVVMGLTARGS